VEVTQAELDRVTAAYQAAAGLAVMEGFALAKGKSERPALTSFLRAWNRLDIEEQSAVSLELARLLSPNEGDLGGDELVLAVDPYDLDVGLAAIRAAESGLGRAGSPIRLPGLKEAAREAYRVWIDRGNLPEVGQLHRVRTTGPQAVGHKKQYHPYPALVFVADLIERVMPKAFPNRQALVIAADSQLRALRQSGAI
jgi:hypothetical protein